MLLCQGVVDVDKAPDEDISEHRVEQGKEPSVAGLGKQFVYLPSDRPE